MNQAGEHLGIRTVISEGDATINILVGGLASARDFPPVFILSEFNVIINANKLI